MMCFKDKEKREEKEEERKTELRRSFAHEGSQDICYSRDQDVSRFTNCVNSIHHPVMSVNIISIVHMSFCFKSMVAGQPHHSHRLIICVPKHQ